MHIFFHWLVLCQYLWCFLYFFHVDVFCRCPFCYILMGVRGRANNKSQNLLPNKQVAITKGGSLCMHLDQSDIRGISVFINKISKDISS